MTSATPRGSSSWVRKNPQPGARSAGQAVAFLEVMAVVLDDGRLHPSTLRHLRSRRRRYRATIAEAKWCSDIANW